MNALVILAMYCGLIDVSLCVTGWNFHVVGRIHMTYDCTTHNLLNILLQHLCHWHSLNAFLCMWLNAGRCIRLTKSFEIC